MRSIYCKPCALKTSSENNGNDQIRRVYGTLMIPCVCDRCDAPLTGGDTVLCFTAIPYGRPMLTNWESQYIEETP